jgi:hypothetical protein
VSQVTLVFDNGEQTEHVHCERVQEFAANVRIGDYIACPFHGFVHVHAVRFNKRAVYFMDCHDAEHIYTASTLLEIARPVEDTDG